MASIPDSHAWSRDALFAKAVLYVDRMNQVTADDWEYPFWSALAMELLARAALAHISPVLLAESNNWRNVLHALGRDPTTKKFSPASVGTKDVIGRLAELIPAFTEEHAGFCTRHTDRRNAELHTGELAFQGLGTATWLPRFYAACKILLESMGKNLKDFVDDPVTAQALIDSLEDAAAKSVQQDIKAHAQVWANKSAPEKAKAAAQAATWATKNAGHRVTCPACQSPALLQGTPSGSVTTKITEEEVTQKQLVLPSSFECVACGLRIAGLSKLSAAALGDAYVATSTYTPAEYFGLYTEDELDEARREGHDFEPDFNEF